MKKRKIPLIAIWIGLIVIILLIGLIIIINNKSKKPIPQAVSFQTDEQTTKRMNKAVDDSIINELKGKSESKRIKYYATLFLKDIQSRNISEAYDMLNSDFKKNYFNNQNAFEEYVKKYIPKEMDIEYVNLERLGSLYVLDVSTKDILNTENPNNFEFYIVVKENDYNNFELSFSVDKPMENVNNE